MKKKTIRHYSHVAHAIHHHHAKHLPKVFYHKGSLFPTIFWKSLFLLFLCSFMGYFLIHNLAPQSTPSLAETQNLMFSLEGSPEDWGVDSASLNTHGAASNEFDFLFKPTDTTTNSTTNIQTSSGTVLNKDQTDVGVTPDSSSDVGAVVEPTSNTTVSQGTASCVSPWGDKVLNGDFVIAYDQRTDVNSICNVQKRYCVDGKITGSYTQKSCKEDLAYSYTKVVPVATNDPQYVDPFIQPGQPSLSGANFDTNGKINTSSNPIDTWSNSGNSPTVSTGPYVTQTTTSSSFCTAPWGEKVPVGHFVKAYRTSVGLIDMPCDVQLRLCTEGGLKGSFSELSCTYKNMTYSDYLLDKKENLDQPNVIDLENTVSSDSTNSIWKRFTQYF